MAETTTRPRRSAPWYNLSLLNLPLPGLVSIFHRVSGILLVLGIAILLFLLDRSLASPEGYAQASAIVGHWFVKLVLLALIWSFAHHFCAGLRFLFLDMHKGIDLATARATSRAVFVVSVLATLILAWVFLW